MQKVMAATSPPVTAPEADWPLSNPWPWLIAGMSAATLALLCNLILRDNLTAVRLVLVFLSLLAGGGAVTIKPISEKVLGGAALIAFLDRWALAGGEANPRA